MPVEEFELHLDDVDLPEEIRAFATAAERAIDAYDDSTPYRRRPNFVHCDPVLLYRALADVTRRQLTIGRVFCEWGSGFGMGVCLASMLGYHAFGIEIDPAVVQFSRDFAASQGIDANILRTSYFPDGFSSYAAAGHDELIRPPGYPDDGSPPLHWPRYEGMGFDTDEIDVFFVYPWPKEHQMMLELFDALAAEQAILIAYYGETEMCAYQKHMPVD